MDKLSNDGPNRLCFFNVDRNGDLWCFSHKTGQHPTSEEIELHRAYSEELMDGYEDLPGHHVVTVRLKTAGLMLNVCEPCGIVLDDTGDS